VLAHTFIYLSGRCLGGGHVAQRIQQHESAPGAGAVMSSLNKGEARNALAQGRITDPTFENQSYRASGLNLVSAAIVYWDALYMGRAVEHLRSLGMPVIGSHGVVRVEC